MSAPYIQIIVPSLIIFAVNYVQNDSNGSKKRKKLCTKKPIEAYDVNDKSAPISHFTATIA